MRVARSCGHSVLKFLILKLRLFSSVFMLLVRLNMHVPQPVCGGRVQPVGADSSLSLAFTAECARLSWAERASVFSLCLLPLCKSAGVLGRDTPASGD